MADCDSYMMDDNAKSVTGMIEGLRILARYMGKGEAQKYFCGAEHDIIYFYVSPEKCSEDSEDGIRLSQLGFHPEEDVDAWGYFS